MAHALAGEFGNNFVCGVIAHPSVHLEKMLFSRDVQAVFEAATKPMLLMNAKVRLVCVFAYECFLLFLLGVYRT
jgi:hypothetical protein